MANEEQPIPMTVPVPPPVQRTHSAAWLWLSLLSIALDQATKFLEVALGMTAGKQRKPEYHQTTRRQNQQRLGT